jgi:acetyl esterase/lipase
MRERPEAGPDPVLDISYGPDAYQCLDVYRPDGAVRAPFAVFIHGGGWAVGDKSQYAAVGARLAREGIVTAIVNYRLSPPAQHPAHAEDVARAVAWCYRQAPYYGADRERFYVLGHSSGAHLAALVALDPTYLAAEGLRSSVIRRLVGIAGVGYDLDESYATPLLTPFLEPVFGSDCSRWAQAAPLGHVTSAAPAALLIHGLSDTDAPPASTQVFATTLQKAGVSTELALLAGENHFSVMFAAEPLILRFLEAAEPARVGASETTR